jgi:putative transposase
MARELTELGDRARDRVLERFHFLRPHLENGTPLATVAREAGVSLRTTQRWVARYRDGGLRALARDDRADRGKRRAISPTLIEFVEGLALARPPLPISAIHREIKQVAAQRGEPQPSEDTVWRVVRSIAPGLTALAREGAKRYADRFDIVLRREADAPNALWQADHTELDLMALRDDGRPDRPWLTVISDDHSRAIAGFAFSFDAPSALRTSLALRQAIWRKAEPHWRICGIPDALYTDNGTDFASNHLEQVAADLKILLIHSIPGVPRGRGKIERLFRTIDDLFLCHQPGYLKGGRTRAGPMLTLAALDDAFRGFVRAYNSRPHSETRIAPLHRWEQSGFLPRMPESLEQLDLLLINVARSRVVHSDGVHFSGYRYMDPTLGAFVGEQVTVRYDPRDIAQIRLFHHGKFLCRAIAPELAGETVALRDIISARKRQRRSLRQTIAQRQKAVEQLLALHGGGENRTPADAESAALSEQAPHRDATHHPLKRYRHE